MTNMSYGAPRCLFWGSVMLRRCRANSMRSIGDGNAPVNYRYNPFTAKAPALNVAPRVGFWRMALTS